MYRILTWLVGLLLIALALAQPSKPQQTATPKRKWRRGVRVFGQILQFVIFPVFFAALVVCAAKNAGGWSVAGVNTLGAVFVALGGSLGAAGAYRELPGSTVFSWAFVAVGGWIVAMGSFEPLWNMLPLHDAVPSEPPTPSPSPGNPV